MSFFTILLVALVVLPAIVLMVALARSGTRQLEKSNEVVPGVASRAPTSWGGEHTPEARLHRRLGAAVRALPRDDVNVLEARIAIEQVALAIDDQLVTVAALPERVRAAPLAQVEAAVEALENGVATVAANELGQQGAAAVEAALAQLNERVALLAEARAELDPPPAAAD